MSRKRIWAAAVALTLFGALASQARAATYNVEYAVVMTNTGGYSASWLHTSTSGLMTKDEHKFWGGGSISHSITGTIYATVDTTGGTNGKGLVTFTGGTMTAEDASGSATVLGFNGTDDITIKILGGSVDVTDDSGTLRPDGILETEFKQGATTLNVDFWFAPYYFADAANSFDGSDLLDMTLWANNWDTSKDPSTYFPDASDRVGIDLRLEGQIVPEPTSVALMGLGLAAAAAARRRRGMARVERDDS